jgi:NTP pyrophosphatase (non-canonical NTP hydrolase)
MIRTKQPHQDLVGSAPVATASETKSIGRDLIMGPGYARVVPNEFEVLRDRLRDFADARDWRKSHSPRNLALALAGEIGELTSELQWVPDERISGHLQDPAARARLADEVADVLIYLIQFADVCGIDPAAAASAKIDRNAVRYPALPRARETAWAALRA